MPLKTSHGIGIDPYASCTESSVGRRDAAMLALLALLAPCLLLGLSALR